MRYHLETALSSYHARENGHHLMSKDHKLQDKARNLLGQRFSHADLCVQHNIYKRQMEATSAVHSALTNMSIEEIMGNWRKKNAQDIVQNYHSMSLIHILR